MKLLDIQPNFLNEELVRKICQNKDLKREYIRKYELVGGVNEKKIDDFMDTLSHAELQHLKTRPDLQSITINFMSEYTPLSIQKTDDTTIQDIMDQIYNKKNTWYLLYESFDGNMEGNVEGNFIRPSELVGSRSLLYALPLPKHLTSFDPNYKHANIELTENNTIASYTSQHELAYYRIHNSIALTQPVMTSGIHYVEFVIQDYNTTSRYSNIIGIVESDYIASFDWVQTDYNGHARYSVQGNFIELNSGLLWGYEDLIGETTPKFVSQLIKGDKFGFVLDLNDRTLKIYKNGVLYNEFTKIAEGDMVFYVEVCNTTIIQII